MTWAALSRSASSTAPRSTVTPVFVKSTRVCSSSTNTYGVSKDAYVKPRSSSAPGTAARFIAACPAAYTSIHIPSQSRA